VPPGTVAATFEGIAGGSSPVVAVKDRRRGRGMPATGTEARFGKESPPEQSRTLNRFPGITLRRWCPSGVFLVHAFLGFPWLLPGLERPTPRNVIPTFPASRTDAAQDRTRQEP